MNNQLLLDNLRCIPDWPIKGVDRKSTRVNSSH